MHQRRSIRLDRIAFYCIRVSPSGRKCSGNCASMALATLIGCPSHRGANRLDLRFARKALDLIANRIKARRLQKSSAMLL